MTVIANYITLVWQMAAAYVILLIFSYLVCKMNKMRFSLKGYFYYFCIGNIFFAMSHNAGLM